MPKIKKICFINKVESQEKNLEILEIPAEETPDKIKIYDDFNDLTTLNNLTIFTTITVLPLVLMIYSSFQDYF